MQFYNRICVVLSSSLLSSPLLSSISAVSLTGTLCGHALMVLPDILTTTKSATYTSSATSALSRNQSQSRKTSSAMSTLSTPSVAPSGGAASKHQPSGARSSVTNLSAITPPTDVNSVDADGSSEPDGISAGIMAVIATGAIMLCTIGIYCCLKAKQSRANARILGEVRRHTQGRRADSGSATVDLAAGRPHDVSRDEQVHTNEANTPVNRTEIPPVLSETVANPSFRIDIAVPAHGGEVPQAGYSPDDYDVVERTSTATEGTATLNRKISRQSLGVANTADYLTLEDVTQTGVYTELPKPPVVYDVIEDPPITVDLPYEVPVDSDDEVDAVAGGTVPHRAAVL